MAKKIVEKRPTRKQEFRDHRTSWKWFARRIDQSIKYRANKDAETEVLLALEILKELQYANDRK